MDRAGIFRDVLADLNREDKEDMLLGWLASTQFKINTLLRVDKMIVHRVMPISETVIPLPKDFLAHVSFGIKGGNMGNPTLGSGVTKGTTIYVTPQQVDDDTRGQFRRRDAGPRYFTIRGRYIELLNWGADQPFQADLYYFAELPVLTEATSTNFLTESAYEIYKLGMVALGFNHLQEFDNADRADARMQSQIAAMNAQYQEEKYGAGPLIARPARRMGGRFS